MNDKFEDQKEKLVSIKHEISLLYQQVNYLLRNEKPLELLDLDVLMNRTHTLYDMLCSINIGEVPDDEDIPFDAEALSGLFGGMVQDETEPEPEPENVATAEDEPVETPAVTVPEPEIEPEPEPQIAPEPQPEPEPEPEPVVAPLMQTPSAPAEEPVEEHVPEAEPQSVVDESVEENSEPEEKPLGDEFGFFFRFENVEETPEEPQKPQTVEQDGKVVHVMEEIPEEEIPERDRVHGEDLVKDNPFEMPKMEDEKMPLADEEMERQNSGSVSGFFEQDDADFELSTGETLGDRMMEEDHSLAAKLQQNPVRDLKSVIGINDKFLFVNELFGGSMEKYNKSIENLNDLKTLNGAMIYLNELKIELQWNSSNEAYQKLADLVRRKFE